MVRSLAIAIGLLVALTGHKAAAETVLKPGFRECVAANLAASAPVIACVEDAMSLCAGFPPGEEAQLGCYLSAKEEWGTMLTELLDSFSDKPADLQAAVRIEAKYALLRHFLNCDFITEMRIIGREAEPADLVAEAQCEAFGSAAGLAEVLFKSGTITR